jgi:hypothetical protein
MENPVTDEAAVGLLLSWTAATIPLIEEP